MNRRPVTVHAAPENEVHFPSAWLSELGFAVGQPATVEVARGRLVLTRQSDIRGVQNELTAVADGLQGLRDRLAAAALQLPEPAESGGSEGPDLEGDMLGTIECVIGDEIDPAIRKLRVAAGITPEELAGGARPAEESA